MKTAIAAPAQEPEAPQPFTEAELREMERTALYGGMVHRLIITVRKGAHADET